MTLPQSIAPCPIIEVGAGVSFETDIPENALPGIIFQEVKADFPKSNSLPLAQMPMQIRSKDPNLARQPLHVLEGDHRQIAIGSGSITLLLRGDYAGWHVLSHEISSVLGRIEKAGIAKKVNRFGLRYINFFEGDAFDKLTFAASISGQSVLNKGTFFRTTLESLPFRVKLQIGNELSIKTKLQTKGTILDIDTYLDNPPINDDFTTSYSAFLEKAHSIEKNLFFSLLRPEFLQTLTPKYDESNR